MKGALNVSKNSLQELKVRFSWSVHEETDLLNSIGNVRPSDSEILKRAS